MNSLIIVGAARISAAMRELRGKSVVLSSGMGGKGYARFAPPNPCHFRSSIEAGQRQFDQLVLSRGSGAEELEAGVLEAHRIPLPEMIKCDNLPFKIAKGLVTGGQMAALVQGGYEITGHNANDLRAAINGDNTDKGINYLSLLDGRALVKELNRQNPGRKFRILTEEELLQVLQLSNEPLAGINFWIWTEKEVAEGSGIFVLRHPYYGYRVKSIPEFRYISVAVLLAEDL